MIEDDVQLIHKILSGDNEAFAALVRKYQKIVHALAWRKIGDFHHAEEITQDVFLQVYKRLSTLKDPQQFSGWLYVITDRCCIAWFRKNKSARQLPEAIPMKETNSSSYSHYISELQAAEASERRYDAVKKLLAKLPESERTVITLYYLGEMTTKEISKFLGVSVNTITSRLQRARKRLQNADTRLIEKMLRCVQLSENLTESILQKVGDIKPVTPSTGKPLLPWAALGASVVLVVLLLGASNQYLVRFQQPYSFEAASEPMVEIIEASIVFETDAKPAVRNQIGRAAAGSERRGTGSQTSETLSTSDTLLPSEAAKVWMPDPALRAAVREALGIPKDSPLVRSDMKRLTALRAEASQITSLVGLEHATNLTSVLLEGNPISDISPLAHLTQLRSLDMAGCQISDTHPLANLTGLESLHLHSNQIEDITPLANLTRLTDLWLANNHIADVQPLENLTLLEDLRIHNNLIADYSSLGTLSLLNFQYDETCESAGLPIQARIQNRSFPSIFKAWGRMLNRPALAYEAQLAHYDLSWIEFRLRFQRTAHGFQLSGNLTETRKLRETLIEMNPHQIFMLEIPMRGADPNSRFHKATYNDDFPWIRDATGNRVSGDDDGTMFLIDFTHPDAQDIIVQQALAVKKCGLYDGIYIGWWHEDGLVLNRYRTFEEEQQARSVILKRIRDVVGDDFLIIVGSSWHKPRQAAPYINGLFIQISSDHPSGYTHERLTDIENTLSWVEENLRSPQVNCLRGWGVETEAPDSPTNLRWMRAFTTMGLTHADGYVLHITKHHGIYWYEFWDAPLGKPIGEKAQLYKNSEGLFIREFTNGWAVYNRSGQPQRIELPEVTTGVASRITAPSHTVPDLDGEIFIKQND